MENPVSNGHSTTVNGSNRSNESNDNKVKITKVKGKHIVLYYGNDVLVRNILVVFNIISIILLLIFSYVESDYLFVTLLVMVGISLIWSCVMVIAANKDNEKYGIIFCYPVHYINVSIILFSFLIFLSGFIFVHLLVVQNNEYKNTRDCNVEYYKSELLTYSYSDDIFQNLNKYLGVGILNVIDIFNSNDSNSNKTNINNYHFYFVREEVEKHNFIGVNRTISSLISYSTMDILKEENFVTLFDSYFTQKALLFTHCKINDDLTKYLICFSESNHEFLNIKEIDYEGLENSKCLGNMLDNRSSYIIASVLLITFGFVLTFVSCFVYIYDHVR